jgi:hypothetical protein
VEHARLHISAHGHALVAAAVLQTLGQPAPVLGQAEQQPTQHQHWLSARRSDAEWVGSYFAPWVGRKLRGRSAGDFVEPKLPELTTVPAGMTR